MTTTLHWELGLVFYVLGTLAARSPTLNILDIIITVACVAIGSIHLIKAFLQDRVARHEDQA